MRGPGGPRATYSGFTDVSLAELVEIDEELFDTDAILGDSGLDSFLNVVLVSKNAGLALVVALMAVG